MFKIYQIFLNLVNCQGNANFWNKRKKIISSERVKDRLLPFHRDTDGMLNLCPLIDALSKRGL